MIEMVAPGELGEIVSGSTPKTHIKDYWNGDIPWITPADLTDHTDVFYRGKLKQITKVGFDSCSTTMMPAGSILFSSRAPIGHCAITAYPLCTNQGFKSLVPNRKLNCVYGYYALRYLTPSIVAIGRGATFAEINKEMFESIRLPVMPLSDQERIAGLLTKCDRLRRTRRYARQLSDTFLQSVFLEMFGSWDYPLYTLQDISRNERHSFVNGPFGSDLLTSELTSHGVPVIYIRDIVKGRYERVSSVCVSEQKAKELEFCQVSSGDVLIAKVGEPPGTSAVYPVGQPTGIITQDVIRIRVNRSIATPQYLSVYLNSDRGRQALEPIIVEGTRARFGLTPFKDLSISIPSLELQEQFGQIVSRFEHLTVKQREAERQAEHLFQTLLHRAFRGELSGEETIPEADASAVIGPIQPGLDL